MPKVLNNQSTADAYTNGNTVQNVYDSKGGWIVNNAQIYCQQQLTEKAGQGSETFGEEFLLTAGAHHLEPGTIGFRVRSFAAGTPVLFSIALFQKYEPGMVLGGSGIATPSTSVASLNFQRNDVAVATEPTADFEDGANVLTWSLVDDPANTRLKITPSFPNTVLFPGIVEIGNSDTQISRGAAGVALIGTTGIGGRWAAQQPAAGNLIFSGAVDLDTVARFQVFASGNVSLGPGNAAADLTYGRLSTAGTILLNVSSTGSQGISTGAVPNSFASLGWVTWSTVQETIGAAAGNNVFVAAVQNDTVFRIQIHTDGAHLWSSGALAVDCTLERSAAGTLRLTNTGLLSTSPTIGMGYGTGSGQAVTQLTSRATLVTINKVSGAITTNATSLAIGATATFTVNNSTVTGTDVVLINCVSGGVAGTVSYQVWNNNSGGFVISYTNNTGAALLVGITFQFNVFKGANA